MVQYCTCLVHVAWVWYPLLGITLISLERWSVVEDIMMYNVNLMWMQKHKSTLFLNLWGCKMRSLLKVKQNYAHRIFNFATLVALWWSTLQNSVKITIFCYDANLAKTTLKRGGKEGVAGDQNYDFFFSCWWKKITNFFSLLEDGVYNVIANFMRFEWETGSIYILIYL